MEEGQLGVEIENYLRVDDTKQSESSENSVEEQNDEAPEFE